MRSPNDGYPKLCTDLQTDLLAAVPITFLDVETTGGSPGYGDRVIEIAALQVQNDAVVAQVDYLINPQRSLRAAAMAVNGITPEMVVDAPVFREILPELDPLLRAGPVLGHNVAFDLKFLCAEYGHAGQVLPDVLAFDTLPVARRHYQFPSNSLGNLARELAIETAQLHRAMSDVLVTYGVFRYFVDDLQLHTVADWLQAQGRRVWPPKQQPQSQSQAIPQAQTYAARPQLLDPTLLNLSEMIELAIAQQSRLCIDYRDSRGNQTTRNIQAFACDGQMVRAYCELRDEMRQFLLDRIVQARLVK